MEKRLNGIEEQRGFLTPEELEKRRQFRAARGHWPELLADLQQQAREEGMEYVVKNWQGR